MVRLMTSESRRGIAVFVLGGPITAHSDSTTLPYLGPRPTMQALLAGHRAWGTSPSLNGRPQRTRAGRDLSGANWMRSRERSYTSFESRSPPSENDNMPRNLFEVAWRKVRDEIVVRRNRTRTGVIEQSVEMPDDELGTLAGGRLTIEKARAVQQL
jgi:hypothetical protein